MSQTPVHPDAMRKAAILVASLDTAAADRLLHQMGEEQASRVRHAIMNLDDVDPAEQELILIEFFGKPKVAAAVDEGVEFQVSAESQAAAEQLILAPQPTGPRFGFLQDTRSEELARRLGREHPQLIAVVVAHLAPEKSAELLRHLSSSLQTEVIERLGQLDEADPESVAEIERELEQMFAATLRSDPRRGKRLDQVQAILGHLDEKTRRRMVVALSDKDPAWNEVSPRTKTAAPLVPPPAVKAKANVPAKTQVSQTPSQKKPPIKKPITPSITFEQLLSLPAEEFFAAFDEADPLVVMLSMAGAPRPLFERYVGQFSPGRAVEMERHLEQLRPLRLRDVEMAQQEVARIADQRLKSAKAAAESSRRFAAAA